MCMGVRILNVCCALCVDISLKDSVCVIHRTVQVTAHAEKGKCDILSSLEILSHTIRRYFIIHV